MIAYEQPVLIDVLGNFSACHATSESKYFTTSFLAKFPATIGRHSKPNSPNFTTKCFTRKFTAGTYHQTEAEPTALADLFAGW